MKSTELKLQLILLKFYGIKRHTCMELELPPLSSQLHISFIFIVEKRFYSVRKTWGLVLLSELLVAGLQIVFELVGSCFPHVSAYKFLGINAENLEKHFQFLGVFFFVKSTFQEYSHVLHRFFHELCRERKKLLFEFAIHVIWDLYMEKKANRGPGFQSFCLEFATHVWSKEFPWWRKKTLDLTIIIWILLQHYF